MRANARGAAVKLQQEEHMENYTKISAADEPRVELHDKLGLTGAEISINSLPAGASVPFVHAHRQNEEIYAVIEGSGKAVIDGDTVQLKAGDWVRIAPRRKEAVFCLGRKRYKIHLHTGKGGLA